VPRVCIFPAGIFIALYDNWAAWPRGFAKAATVFVRVAGCVLWRYLIHAFAILPRCFVPCCGTPKFVSFLGTMTFSVSAMLLSSQYFLGSLLFSCILCET
jgi:hypothetical protein